MGSFVRFLIEKPLVTHMITSALIVLGVMAAYTLNREGYPQVDLDKVTIVTFYPGASPEDVELNVTIKIEDAIKSISGIQKFTSKSVEGRSTIKIYVDPAAEDKKQVKTNIRWAVNGVTDLPDEVTLAPKVTDITTDEAAVYEVALSHTEGDYRALHDHAQKLRDRIKNINQVAGVRLGGFREKEFHVVVDRRKLNQHYVSFDEIIDAIKQNKVRVTGGNIESFTNEVGIIAISEFASPEDLETMIIRSTTTGNLLRIGDVAKVVPTFAKEETILRYNGQTGIGLFVEKNASADIIDTVAAVREVIQRYQDQAGSQLNIFPLFDLSIDTQTRLEIVSSNMLAGFFLVLLVLFFFLDWRVALWSSIGIPISVAAAAIVMAFMGVTFNSISLCGMVVVLGMIVDDAIIIAESIYKNLEKGMAPTEAAVEGLRVVVKPVLGTILSTIIAFIPIYFVPGTVGQFSAEIPTIVIIMLVASFFEATTLLPAHIGHVRDPENFRVSVPPGKKVLAALENMYRTTLALALRYRVLVFIVLTFVATVSVIIGARYYRFVMFPNDQAYQMIITGKVEDGHPVSYTAKQVRAIEQAIDRIPKGVVQGYRATVGLDLESDEEKLFPVPSHSSFFMYVSLTPFSQREMTALDVRKHIRESIAADKSHTITKMHVWIQTGGPPVGKPIEVKVTGDDTAEIEAARDAILALLPPLHVYDIDSGKRPGKQEYRYLPNHEALSKAGVSWSSVASTIKSAFDGSIVTHQQTPSERVPIRVIGDQDQVDFSKPLSELKVANRTGRMLRVSPLVNKEHTVATSMISRYNSKRSVTIQGNVDRSKTTPAAVYESLQQSLETIRRAHPGVTIESGGEAKESADISRRMLKLLLAAVGMIFVLLVIQFNSLVQPLMVILAVPFGLIGVQLAFVLQGLDLSLLAMVGVIGFAGVVINDSLIMVDYINQLRRKMRSGEQKGSLAHYHSAIIDGAAARFRPIVLTTVTTVSGLIPTAYGLIGGVDSFISPLVMAMTWGLIIGTPAVLIVVPILYALNEDIAKILRR